VARTVGEVPLIATGGIADGASVAAVLCAGAAAAQVGTALMLSPEAGTTEAQRALLREPIPTGLTRAFSGRLARGMINRFQAEHSEAAPVAYPEIHHLTSPLRGHARRSGDADGFNLWAGQAHELTVEAPAGESSSGWPPRRGRRWRRSARASHPNSADRGNRVPFDAVCTMLSRPQCDKE
jgi:nitronate monooxygenase